MNRLRYDGNHFRRSLTRFFKLTSGGIQRPSQQVHKFSRTAGWTFAGFAPVAQFTGGLASERGRVHMMGGRTGLGSDSNEGSVVHTVLNNDAWSFSTELLPPIRKNNSAASSSGNVYILGGFNSATDPDPSRRRFDRFSPDSQSWNILESYLHDVQNPGLVGHGDALIAFGGDNFVSSSYYGDTNHFSALTSSWDVRQSMATTLAAHSYAGIGATASYAMCGYTGSTFTNLTRRYDADVDVWVNLAPRPATANYRRSAAMEIGGKVVSYSGPENTGLPSARPPFLAEFDGAAWLVLTPLGAPVTISDLPHPQQTVGL